MKRAINGQQALCHFLLKIPPSARRMQPIFSRGVALSTHKKSSYRCDCSACIYKSVSNVSLNVFAGANMYLFNFTLFVYVTLSSQSQNLFIEANDEHSKKKAR